MQYKVDNIMHKLNISKEDIILVRENNEFKNTLIFSLNKQTVSNYLLKENNLLIDINIKTKKIEKDNDKITIIYEVMESSETYEYQIEMRNMYEY